MSPGRYEPRKYPRKNPHLFPKYFLGKQFWDMMKSIEECESLCSNYKQLSFQKYGKCRKDAVRVKIGKMKFGVCVHLFGMNLSKRLDIVTLAA